MQLSKNTATQIQSGMADAIPEKLFALPEKVLQFGTGVLLRGLPDYYIDKANKKGIFNGRIIVIKSTDRGGTDAFAEQDGVYTQLLRGRIQGEAVEQAILNSSISRVLSALENWEEILEAALQPELSVIISNTTEVGISYEEEQVLDKAPHSFPGKLLAILYHRYKTYDGDASKGFVIIPTELISDNGVQLKDIVKKLAAFNQFPAPFTDWLESANTFCNSLVDRIVPGKLSKEQLAEKEQALGYSDHLLISSEPYGLWAIQTNSDQVKEKLSFAEADSGVIIAPDISYFRELKLRLLNGSHSLSCGLAVLAGIKLVREGMQDATFRAFLEQLLFQELIPSLPVDVPTEEAISFARQVLDRYDNPFIDHPWLSITLQYSKKMAMRTVPLLLTYRERQGSVPAAMALGWAAFILFMKTTEGGDGNYYGDWQGTRYRVDDSDAGLFAAAWKKDNAAAVQDILSHTDLWGTDLSAWPEWLSAVTKQVAALQEGKVGELMHSFLTLKTNT